jgi:hypothetical protein
VRDKIAHQTGFPLDYDEYSLMSEKEHAVVSPGENFSMPLPSFVELVRAGVVKTYFAFEDEIICAAMGRPAAVNGG